MRLTVFGWTRTSSAASSHVKGRSTVDRLASPSHAGVIVLLFPPPVALLPGSGSVDDSSNFSLIRCSGSCAPSSGGSSVAHDRSDCRTDAFIGRRGACCLEDAVFSRRSNWRCVFFMLSSRSQKENLHCCVPGRRCALDPPTNS